MMTHDLCGSMDICMAMSEGSARTMPCDLAGARQCEMYVLELIHTVVDAGSTPVSAKG